MKNAASRLRALIMRADQSSGSLGRVGEEDIAALRFALWTLEKGVLPQGVDLPATQRQVVSAEPPATIESTVGQSDPAPGAGEVSASAVQESPASSLVELCLDAAQDQTVTDGVTLCVDFGTAASKAFAMRGWRDPVDLALGKIAGSPDHYYPVESSLFVGEDGYVRFGPKAVEASLRVDGRQRHRFDSIKSRFNAGSHNHPDEVELNAAQNPFHRDHPLTEGEAIRLYLAYLMALIGFALEQKGLSRHLKRRIARPCWSSSYRQWAQPILWRMVAEGQILADTFGDRLLDGISIIEAKQAISLLRELDDSVVERVMGNILDMDVAEAVAVSAPFATDAHGGWHFFFVVDVGAGTTDLGLFLAQVHEDTDRRRVRQIPGTLLSLSKAGDYVDSILQARVQQLGGMDLLTEEGRQANISLRNNLRRLKETLYREGSVSVPVASGRRIDVALEQFMELDSVRILEREISELIQRALQGMHESWTSAIGEKGSGTITVLITGGGHSLPMVRNAVPEKILVHGRQLHLKVENMLPRWAEDADPAVRQAYRLLAVAAGGATPEVPTEEREFSSIA